MPSLAERSLAVFPAGSNGEFNLPAELSMVIDRGQGCELWDCDGARYYDFSMGWGSVLAQGDCVISYVSNKTSSRYSSLQAARRRLFLTPTFSV